MKTLKYINERINTKKNKNKKRIKTKRKSNFRNKKSRRVYKGGVFTPVYTDPTLPYIPITYDIGAIIRDIDSGVSQEVLFKNNFPDLLSELIIFFQEPQGGFRWRSKIYIVKAPKEYAVQDVMCYVIIHILKNSIILTPYIINLITNLMILELLESIIYFAVDGLSQILVPDNLLDITLNIYRYIDARVKQQSIRFLLDESFYLRLAEFYKILLVINQFFLIENADLFIPKQSDCLYYKDETGFKYKRDKSLLQNHYISSTPRIYYGSEDKFGNEMLSYLPYYTYAYRLLRTPYKELMYFVLVSGYCEFQDIELIWDEPKEIYEKLFYFISADGIPYINERLYCINMFYIEYNFLLKKFELTEEQKFVFEQDAAGVYVWILIADHIRNRNAFSETDFFEELKSIKHKDQKKLEDFRLFCKKFWREHIYNLYLKSFESFSTELSIYAYINMVINVKTQNIIDYRKKESGKREGEEFVKKITEARKSDVKARIESKQEKKKAEEKAKEQSQTSQAQAAAEAAAKALLEELENEPSTTVISKTSVKPKKKEKEKKPTQKEIEEVAAANKLEDIRKAESDKERERQRLLKEQRELKAKEEKEKAQLAEAELRRQKEEEKKSKKKSLKKVDINENPFDVTEDVAKDVAEEVERVDGNTDVNTEIKHLEERIVSETGRIITIFADSVQKRVIDQIDHISYEIAVTSRNSEEKNRQLIGLQSGPLFQQLLNEMSDFRNMALLITEIINIIEQLPRQEIILDYGGNEELPRFFSKSVEDQQYGFTLIKRILLLIIGDEHFIHILSTLYGCIPVIIGSTSLLFNNEPISSHSDIDIVISPIREESPHIFAACVFASYFIQTVFNECIKRYYGQPTILPGSVISSLILPKSNIVKLSYREPNRPFKALMDISYKNYQGAPDLPGVDKSSAADIESSQIRMIQRTELLKTYTYTFITIEEYKTETLVNVKHYISLDRIQPLDMPTILYCIKSYFKLRILKSMDKEKAKKEGKKDPDPDNTILNKIKEFISRISGNIELLKQVLPDGKIPLGIYNYKDVEEIRKLRELFDEKTIAAIFKGKVRPDGL